MEANQNIAGVMGNINMINYIRHQRSIFILNLSILNLFIYLY